MNEGNGVDPSADSGNLDSPAEISVRSKWGLDHRSSGRQELEPVTMPTPSTRGRDPIEGEPRVAPIS